MDTKKKLNTSLSLAVEVFTILLSICLGFVGYQTYYLGMIQKYKDYEVFTLNLAVNGFDWDALDQSIQKNEEDEALLRLRKRMDYIKSNAKINWLYMLVPLNAEENNNMQYICTGNTEEEYKAYKERGEDIVRLGKLSGTEYPPEVAQKYLDFYMNSEPGEYWYYPNKTEWGSVYTTSIVVRNSAGKALGVMSVDINMTDIDATLRVYPVRIFVAGFILAVFFILILILWLNRRVIYPLKRLQHSASDFVQKANGDDLESLKFKDPDIQTKDEIQSLAKSLISMATDTKNYMQRLLTETKELERISTDLNVATKIQADMLPRIDKEFSNRSDFELAASMTPAKEVGGDFYDFFFIDDDHLALVMADVSGKGVPAALFMAISKTIIKNRALFGSLPLPSEVLQDANNQLCEGNEANLFVTVWLGILDLNTGILKAANAGHEYPVVRQPGKDFEFVQDKHGLVLAGFEGAKYKDYEIVLEKGSTLFIYTDGVPEATNADEKLFELDRLKNALNINADASPEDLLSNVRSEVDKFVGSAPQFDDLTMLAIKFKGRK